MKYKIHKVERIVEDGSAVHQLITLDTEYNNESHTLHSKAVELGADVKEEAVSFAAELEGILEEPKVVTKEEVELSANEKEIKSSDVESKMADIEQ